MSNIMAEPKMSKHAEAILYINRLVIDLKLQLGGVHEEERAITVERLEEWAKNRRELEQCYDENCKVWR